MRVIQSTENPLIKQIKKVKKNPEDKIFLEGLHLIEASLVSDYVYVERVLVTQRFLEKNTDFSRILHDKRILLTVISERVAKAISDTVTPQGVFALVNFKVKDINISNPSLVVIADQIQDPGNLGTIIRAADAFGADAVLFTHRTTNPFSNKALRASAGSIFFIPVIKTTAKQIEELVYRYRLNLIITDIRATISPFNIDLTKPLAIVLGNESSGVSKDLRSIKHIACKIPHKGKAESLNVAMAATALLYEILRQRSLNSK